jgi:hypothetical protein
MSGFTEQETVPTVVRDGPWRTGVPRKLLAIEPFTAKCAYDQGTVRFDPTVVQRITVYPSAPLFLMSPGMRVYRKADVEEFFTAACRSSPCCPTTTESRWRR